MLDFHHMIPKLFVQLREHALNKQHVTGKARASGYSHTYNDNRGIDLTDLATFPSDGEITRAAKEGYEEAQSLFALLGVLPGSGQAMLPSIRSWYVKQNETEDGLEGQEILLGEEIIESTPNTLIQLQELHDYVNTAVTKPYLSEAAEKRLKCLSYASIAIAVEASTAM